MAINIEKLITQIDARYAAIDSNTSALEQFRINQARDRLNNSGVNALTYNSTGQLPSTADSAFLGTIAYVKTDDVFGDSDGAFYIATGRDSGWVRVASTQDSDEGAIAAPTPGPAGPTPIAYGGSNAYVIYQGIGKFDMSSSTNATQIPALGSPYYPAVSREIMGGRSSTHGYFSGGGVPTTVDTIRSFPFAAEDALSDTTADLTQIRRAGGLEATGDGIDVYTLGGFNPGIGAVDTVDKFPTANNSNATDVGNLTVAAFGLMPATSSTHGYRSGGGDPGAESNVIDKFPFASGGNSTDVGDNTDHRQRGVGASSTTHGYAAGGYDLPARINIIDKYPFSSDTNASDVGDLTGTDHDGAGASSPTYGFFMGGGAGTTTNEIQRWAFASDGNATDTADLYEAVRYAGSTHDTA